MKEKSRVNQPGFAFLNVASNVPNANTTVETLLATSQTADKPRFVSAAALSEVRDHAFVSKLRSNNRRPNADY